MATALVAMSLCQVDTELCHYTCTHMLLLQVYGKCVLNLNLLDLRCTGRTLLMHYHAGVVPVWYKITRTIDDVFIVLS